MKIGIVSKSSVFDTFIVDLDYPLEKAFLLLDKIKNDYHFSDIVVFVSVSTKEQIVKLRHLTLGADGYISKNIDAKTFIQKAKEDFIPVKRTN
jgi:CheY-like chemotaxis protein